MPKVYKVGDEYLYTVDGKTCKFKIVEFAGERIYSIRWVNSRQAWTKSITSHKLEWLQ